MRFLVTALVFALMSTTQALGGSHDHGKKSFTFEYDWGVSISDENLGRDTEDDADFKVRAIESYASAEVDFTKEWDGIKAAVSFNLTKETPLETAVVTAELPRSYLSIALGKGVLNFAGFQEYASAYLSYHNPFPTYGPMLMVFAPIEGFGELSLMVTNDVMQSDDDDRWHNDDKSPVGMFQHTHTIGVFSTLLQFAKYDYYNSWAAAAGVSIKSHGMTLHFDAVYDKRKLTDDQAEHLSLGLKDDEVSFTTYQTYTVGASYRHGMIKPWGSVSLFMTANEDVENVDGNVMPAEAPEGLKDDASDEDKQKHEAMKAAYAAYDEHSHLKYATNMMVASAGVNFYCMDSKLIPYVSYEMRSHRIDTESSIYKKVSDWGEDSDTENQVSHSFAIGIGGTI